MSKHNHDHFIPSPYPVVTAYENEFIKKYNNTMSAAVSEVLKYMAKVTAAEIKKKKMNLINKIRIDNVQEAENILKAVGGEELFEKAKWNVGDEKVYQGITYFVSGFSAKGSPLWKKKKDQGQQKKNTAGVSSNKSSVTTTNSITTSTAPVDTTATPTPKNSQKADFQVSKTADGKRFSFNYSGKEYQFDSKKKATELSALLSKTNNGRGIQKVFEYLSENFPNPISGMSDNQLIHLGYIPSGDFHGNSQDQRSHRYDPINVANRVCESVMVGKKQVSDFLPEIIYLRNIDHGVKSLYDRYRQWVPTELMENKKHYEKIVNNSMETATRKQSARQHLQAISLITDAYDKFFSQWND